MAPAEPWYPLRMLSPTSRKRQKGSIDLLKREKKRHQIGGKEKERSKAEEGGGEKKTQGGAQVVRNSLLSKEVQTSARGRSVPMPPPS